MYRSIMESGKRIAVVGGGISGLGIAKELSSVAQVTVFERADKVGGWLNTKKKVDGLASAFEGGARLIKNDKEARHFWELV